jgi:hypothetical protein
MEATTSINDLPGNKVGTQVDEEQNMNEMISSVQKASQGGVINLPARDVPVNPESTVTIDPEVQSNYIDERPTDYINTVETNEQLIASIKQDERGELKRIELYDSIHAYVIMACVYFFFMLPFFHRNVMMKYLSFGLNSGGNMNLAGYLVKTAMFVGACFSITESINYLDRISDI